MDQYKNSRNLRNRGNLHARYGNRSWFDFVAEKLPLVDGMNIADIGCGGGWFWLSAALPRNLRLTLVDNSSGMVDEAVEQLRTRKPYSQYDGHVADASALPFKDRQFDAVIAMHMLYHVKEPEIVIAEMERILRPGGFVAVSTNSNDNLQELFALGAKAFGGAAQDPAASIFSATHAQELLACQFEQVDIHYYEDNYAIDDAEDIYLYLTSFPPGIDAGTQQKEELRMLIAECLSENGGVLKTRHRVALVCGQ